MYYNVIKENCKEGIKSHYLKNQRISDNEIYSLMNEFKQYKYEIRDELNKKFLEFYDYNMFNEKVTLYFLGLSKIR